MDSIWQGWTVLTVFTWLMFAAFVAVMIWVGVQGVRRYRFNRARRRLEDAFGSMDLMIDGRLVPFRKDRNETV